MSQVVQAKCPHCQNVLRIPAEWLSKSMRCKFCKKAFQAKANTPTPAGVTAAAPAAKPVGAVQQAVPVGTPSRSAGGGEPFSFEEGETTPTPSIARPRKKLRGCLLMAGLFLFLFVLGTAAAGYVGHLVYKAMTTPSRPEPKTVAKIDEARLSPAKVPNKPDLDEPRKKDPAGVADPMNKDTKKIIPPPLLKKDLPPLPKKDLAKNDPIKVKTPPPANDPFPRRALLISVNNYLMFSTVHYGSPMDTSFKGGYPGSSTGVLRDRLIRPPMNFPATQVVELSDGVPLTAKVSQPHPTQKMVIETTIQEFLDAARDQDRLLILFAGHGAHLDGKSYLIPSDGNIKQAESLIPLQWVYDRLAKSKGQQKLLILDTFRFSPSRGFEFPTTGEGEEGKMPEGFDKDLQNPPPGVQVWCSCIKEQSAVELDAGSAFLQALCHSLQGGGEMTGISAPTQPFPLEVLVPKVNQRLKDLLTPEKRTQTARLSGKEPDGPNKYDPKEPLPPQLTLKMPNIPGGTAGLAQVNNILDELKILPPVRDARIGDISLLNAKNLPVFPAEKLDRYKPDGYQNITELQKRYKANTEMFAKEFPLRASYFDALDKLQASSKLQMREVLPSPIDPKRKAGFLQEQEPLGQSIFHLEGVLAQMRMAAEKRDDDTSKRWQANFDYVQARLLSRLVYLYEYNYTLGQIRADNLPELVPGQSGWRIGSSMKPAVKEKKVKEYLSETKKLWKRVQDQYPGTPWALLAQRESMISLGLQWRPKSD